MGMNYALFNHLVRRMEAYELFLSEPDLVQCDKCRELCRSKLAEVKDKIEGMIANNCGVI